MNLGIPEMLIILAIVILIFGANRLPEIGRGIGKGIRNFKDATKEGTEGADKPKRWIRVDGRSRLPSSIGRPSPFVCQRSCFVRKLAR